VARSVDGGKTFEWLTVAGYEKRDFRDIEAFDANTAIIMGIAEPAVILKTKDGGKNWYKVFEDTTKGMFLDAMDFDEKGNGFVIGDPVAGNLFEAFTVDNGDHWTSLNMPDPAKKLADGEAFFASSGSNIVVTGNIDYPTIYATGGTVSRLFYKEKIYPLNIIQGKESTGANSVAIDPSGKNAVIVGGDFSADTFAVLNCVLIKLKNKPEVKHPKTPPHGYRSCVEYITKNKLITCGTSGVDISTDGGMNWQLISKQSFHVCQKAKKGNAVFLAGGNGKIARLEY
ncbi:MAG: oxidoreductase, partial [Panacibacter sp.]